MSVQLQINQQNGKNTVEIRIIVNLDEESLITHVVIKYAESLKQVNLKSFEIMEQIDELQQYQKMLKSKEICSTQDIKITGLGIGKKVRITLIAQDMLDLQKSNNNTEMKIRNKFHSIQLCGYQLFQTPSANQMVSLLNISHIFKNSQKDDQQVDILLGLSLLSSRRYIQAAEIFRKVALDYATRASFIRKKDYYFHKASSMQLLVADSINQPSMLHEKLQALKIAALYYNQIVQPDPLDSMFATNNPDTYECIIRIYESLLQIISRVLLNEDNFDTLKMANLRCLEFIIEQIGIGLGSQIVQIFRLFQKILLKPQQQIILEMINKLTAMLLQELPQGTQKLVHLIWEEVVLSGLFESNSEGQKLISKVCESLLFIEQANYKIQIPFLKQLSQLNDDKLWNLVLQSIIPKINDNKQVKIVNWINQQLSEELNFTSYNSLQLQQQKNILKLLNLIQAIMRAYKEDNQLPLFHNYLNKSLNSSIKLSNLYLKPNFTMISLKPILLKLLDQSVSSKISQDCFQTVWDIIIEILVDSNEEEQIFELVNPFLENIFTHCKQSNPTQDLLIVLHHILISICEKCPQIIQRLDNMYEYLEIFTTRVPHSIFDETFRIFDLLLQFSVDLLDENLIEKCILSLIDQYTVKGQAQKQSKSTLIKLILPYLHNVNSFIYITLIQNPEPQLIIQKQQDDIIIDNKQLQQNYEIFIEKIQFLQEMFLEISQYFKFISGLINLQEVRQAFSDLVQSRNSKIRQKVYQILQCMADGILQSDISTKSRLLEDSMIYLDFLTSTVKYSLQEKMDQKSLLSALLIINTSFRLKFQKSDQDKILVIMDNIWDSLILNIDTSNNNIQQIIYDNINIWAQLLQKFQNNQQFDTLIDNIFKWALQQLDCDQSWHQYNILKFCGYLFGLDVGKNFRKYDQVPVLFWEKVFSLQIVNYQNKQLQLMALVLIQLCCPENITIKLTQQQAEQFNLIKHKISKQKDQINKYSDHLIHSLFLKAPKSDVYFQSETFGSSSIEESEFNQDNMIWMKKIDQETLCQCLQTLFTYQQQQESKLKHSDIQERENSIRQINQVQKNILDDDPLDFDELGIIEVDDEEWNEYDDLRKIPILKDKVKAISPQIGSRSLRPQYNERRLSGNRQNQDRKQDKYIQDDQLMKTLRPHNQVFRPLTPPIGQQVYTPNNNQFQTDIQIFSDYMMQNPLSFQKIIEEIKNNTNHQIQQQQEIPKQQYQQKPQQQIEEPDSIIDNVQRRVDELEFDPQFSNSSQDEQETPVKIEQKPKSVKKKKASKIGLQLSRTNSDTEKIKKQQKRQMSSDDKVKSKKKKNQQ
ncbi:hypothetical protein pb186bvf_008955 [Paramecium bursaria]